MALSPSTDNYVLGKGIVFFNQLVSGVYQGERDLGNAPAFTFNIALEKLEHFSSRGGLKAKDKEIISQITPGLAFTLDEVNAENLALLTLGTVTKVTQTSGTVTNETIVARLDKRTDLAKRNVSAVVVKDKATGLITYSNVTDYRIETTLKDDVIGRIKVLSTGIITEGQELTVAYSYAGSTYTQIAAFANTLVEGKLRFVSDNPAGTQQELEVWRVSLTPAGDTALIGDDWSTLGFTGEILKDEVGHPTSPYMSIIMT